MPTSYPALMTYITVDDASRAIEFYKASFGAAELLRLVDPQSGKVGHAELSITGQVLMLSDEFPQHNTSPKSIGGNPVKLSLKVTNADAAYQHSISLGATGVMPPQNQFYGHRAGSVRDPFGYEWLLWHEIETLTPEEIQLRWSEMCKPK